MQTFITEFNIFRSAENLDNKRLGKQRIEAIQIANDLLIKPTRWRNHPAVKMWRKYELFLVSHYLFIHLNEWKKRGYKNDKCLIHFRKLLHVISKKDNLKIVDPPWLTNKFIESHRSNLIRKDYDYYKPLFPNTIENLPYDWPI